MTVINMGEDITTSDVETKAELYEDLRKSDTYVQAKLAANTWCAAFIIPKRPDHPAITDSTIRSISQGDSIGPDILAAVADLSEKHKFLHLHLAFPDVYEMSDGFDLVIGNPALGRVNSKRNDGSRHETQKSPLRRPRPPAKSSYRTSR